MAVCRRCGKKGLFLTVNPGGLCKQCESNAVSQGLYARNVVQSIKQSPNHELKVYYVNGKLLKTIPFIPNLYDNRDLVYDARIINSDGVDYDLENEESVKSITCPTFKGNASFGLGVTGSLEYVLRMKAGRIRTSENHNISIHILLKATEMMKNSDIYWKADDFLRIVDYLYEDGRFDDAEMVYGQLNTWLDKNRNPITESLTRFHDNLKLARELGTDLVEMSAHCPTCVECAKIQGSIFSISGRNKRFPKIPDEFYKFGGVHEGCRHTLFPYVLGSSMPTHSASELSRYYKKSTSPEGRKEYEQSHRENNDYREYLADRKEYFLIKYKLPDIAPKSYGGYRRMKKQNTENYKKIKLAAEEIGITII